MHEGTKLRSGVIQREREREKKEKRDRGDKGSRTITCGWRTVGGENGNYRKLRELVGMSCHSCIVLLAEKQKGAERKEEKENRGRMKRNKWRGKARRDEERRTGVLFLFSFLHTPSEVNESYPPPPPPTPFQWTSRIMKSRILFPPLRIRKLRDTLRTSLT